MRDEEWPTRYRYKCLACEDTGAESYFHPVYPTLVYRRPCKHCGTGSRTLAAWRSEKGVWNDLDPQELSAIMSRPCHHDLLPQPLLAG